MTEKVKPIGRLDADAFMALVREYDLRHRRLAYQLLGDRERMDDALQDAYARAFRALPLPRRRVGGELALPNHLQRVPRRAAPVGSAERGFARGMARSGSASPRSGR